MANRSSDSPFIHYKYDTALPQLDCTPSPYYMHRIGHFVDENLLLLQRAVR